MIQASIIESAFLSDVMLGKTSEGDTWCGTRWWMVRDYGGGEPSVETLDKAIAPAMAASVPLTWKADADGSRRIARPAHHDKDVVRVYERPDGVTVLINETFLLAIESMVLTTEGEYDEDGYIEPVVSSYTLLQADDPIGPIAVVTDKDRVVGIVMPIRHG